MKQQTGDALDKISKDGSMTFLPKYFVRIKGALIHYRFKSDPKNDSSRFPFNINQNTLKGEYELWVCDTRCWYLIPIDIIRMMYNDPDAYRNKTEGQEDMTTITAHVDTDIVDYGRNNKKMSIKQYRNKTI